MSNQEHQIGDIVEHTKDYLLIMDKYVLALSAKHESTVYDVLIIGTNTKIKGMFLQGTLVKKIA